MFICVINEQANVRYHYDTVHQKITIILEKIKRALGNLYRTGDSIKK